MEIALGAKYTSWNEIDDFHAKLTNRRHNFSDYRRTAPPDLDFRFCKKVHIRPDKTLAFTAAEVNKDGILILDLNEVRSVRKI